MGKIDKDVLGDVLGAAGGGLTGIAGALSTQSQAAVATTTMSPTPPIDIVGLGLGALVGYGAARFAGANELVGAGVGAVGAYVLRPILGV